MTSHFSTSERADLQALLRTWVAARPASRDLAAVEALAVEVGAIASEVVFQEQAQQCSGKVTYQGSRRPCLCGKTARFVGYRGRWVQGRPGIARVLRAYYQGLDCDCSFFPWDLEQGLDQKQLTPSCKALAAELCASLGSHSAARSVLKRHFRLDLSISTLENVTQSVGDRIRAAESARTTKHFDEQVWPTADPVLRQAAGKRFYLSLDAGKAHIDGGWHDVKVAAYYLGEPPPPSTRKEDDAPGVVSGATPTHWDRSGPKRYLAIQEEAEAFGRRAYVEALRLGWERAREAVVVADGAEWIWKLVQHHFSDAIQILDFYHASGHVWDLAKLFWAVGDPAGSAWGRASAASLQAEGVRGLLAALRERRRQWKAQGLQLSPETRAAAIKELHYFRKNRRRMRYPEFRARGLMIGSGPVEAACKIVINARLKGTGMRWSAGGADAMLAVRTAVLGGQHQEIARLARAA